MEINHQQGSSVKRKGKPYIVVVTGAESTGKSTLTRQLANHYAAPFYPEYAREYLEKYGPGYSCQDVVKIAREQVSQMKEALSLDSRLVFFDTWLIITKVWLEVVFGKAPRWITKTICKTPVDLFLLCNTDIPWINEPLRENGGEMREKLSEIYVTNLQQFGFEYCRITGTGNERLESAIRIINEKLYWKLSEEVI